MITSEIQLVLTAVTLALLSYGLHRLRRALREIRREIKQISEHHLQNLFQQFQAFDTLGRELDLARALPPLRVWAASPDFLLLLAEHAKAATPAVVVECGSGASTVVLARCMQQNNKGHVYSLEHDTNFGATTRRYLERHGLLEWATIVDAPLGSQEIHGRTWNWYAPKTPLPERIDMLVVDGPPAAVGHLARYPAGPLFFGRMNTGGSVFLDDVIRNDEKEIVRRWLLEFPKLHRTDHCCEKGCTELEGF